jgi:hypothetical protein
MRTRTKIPLAVLALAWALLPAGRLPAADTCIDTDAVNAAIEKAGAKWKAGPTSMSCLSDEEKARLFHPLALQTTFPGGASLTPPPVPPDVSPDLPSFSWHDYEGSDWMTPVRNQGACGGCWAFASVAAIEGAFNVELGDPDIDIDMSEQFIIACSEGNCDSGGMPQDVFEYVAGHGIPDEACYPYIEANGRCSDACADVAARSFHVSAWGWISDFIGRVRAMKVRIAAAPIITSMVIYTDFLSYTEGVYVHVSGENEGGHSVALVGWNDANNSWICKNSWGEDWGMDGYFEIDRGQAFIGYDAAWVDVDSSVFPGFPCLTPESQDVEVVSRGDPVTLSVELRNCGSAVLDWTAEPDPTTGWLAVAPPSGTLEVDALQSMTVTIDPATMGRIGPWSGSARVIGPMGEDRSYLNINVTAVAPTADFSADILEGPAPLPVQFTELATGTAETFLWDFGDGTTDGSRNPAHTYADPGTYTVTLTVSGDAGEAAATKADYIRVLPPGDDTSVDGENPEDEDGTTQDDGGDGQDDGGGKGCGCTVAR